MNDKEIEEELKKGKKTKMIYEYDKNFLENLHFEEARAIFMMLTRMIEVKANFKNKYKSLECETCKVEENTNHLFKCERYHDLNRNIKGETLQEVLKYNNEDEIAKIMKEIIKRKKNEVKEKDTKKKTPNNAPLPKGLSLLDRSV